MTNTEFEEADLRFGDRIKYIGNKKEILSIQEKNGGYLTVKKTGKAFYFSYNLNHDYWIYYVEVKEKKNSVLFLPELELYGHSWSYERDY